MSPPCLKIFKSFPWHLGKISSLYAASALRLLPRFFIARLSFHNCVSTSLKFIYFFIFFSHSKLFFSIRSLHCPGPGITGPSVFFASALVWPAQKQHILSFPLFIITSVILNQILHTFKKILFHSNYSTPK